MLIFSFSCVKNELLPSHPLELSEKNVSMLPVFLFYPLVKNDVSNTWLKQFWCWAFDYKEHEALFSISCRIGFGSLKLPFLCLLWTFLKFGPPLHSSHNISSLGDLFFSFLYFSPAIFAVDIQARPSNLGSFSRALHLQVTAARHRTYTDGCDIIPIL